VFTPVCFLKITFDYNFYSQGAIVFASIKYVKGV